MNLSESLKIASKCIKANWMRSLLTMLGIIIGISSVIMIVGAGTGARDYIVSMIEDMGSNAVLVTVDSTKATDTEFITLEDVENIKNKLHGVEGCSPVMMGFSKASTTTTREAMAAVAGVNADVQFALPTECKYGRFFTDQEYTSAAPVVVIDTIGAKMIFGYEDVAGEYITLSSSGSTIRAKIVGVADIEALTKNMGVDMAQMTEMMQTDVPAVTLFMPCTSVIRLTGAEPLLPSIFVFADDDTENMAVGNAVVNYLKATHGNMADKLYMAQDMATYVEMVNIIISILTAFIACVGAISLIVGGIGVMNIMLVSVTERTREIGIRKSLGAKTKVITLQFLTESVILCLIGGALGVLFGVAGSTLVCKIVGIEPHISFAIIAIALLFSCGVGIFFGIYPARKAAKMSPIEALRRD